MYSGDIFRIGSGLPGAADQPRADDGVGQRRAGWEEWGPARTPKPSAVHASASGMILLAVAEAEVPDRLVEPGLRPRRPSDRFDPGWPAPALLTAGRALSRASAAR
jgi:hypothetical protein